MKHISLFALCMFSFAAVFSACDQNETTVMDAGSDPIVDGSTTDSDVDGNTADASLTCGDGYTKTSGICVDIDQCAAQTDDCGANATCTNVPGLFTCACNTGYSGDGKTCTDIDECAGKNKCDVNATCANTDGDHTCTCNSGYSGDGETCTPIVIVVPAQTDL